MNKCERGREIRWEGSDEEPKSLHEKFTCFGQCTFHLNFMRIKFSSNVEISQKLAQFCVAGTREDQKVENCTYNKINESKVK